VCSTNVLRLTNQLIQALFAYDPIAMDIDVHAVILIGGSSVQSHAKMDWLSIRALDPSRDEDLAHRTET